MSKLILVSGTILALSACSSVDHKKAEEEMAKPVNCATAEGDIRVLEAEKAHTRQQITSGVTGIAPIGLVVHTAKGDEGKTMRVASGKYNKMIDAKIAEIKSECGIE